MAPHVIIVGGGFGGLSAARALRGAAIRVTLLDKRNYHLFCPSLLSEWARYSLVVVGFSKAFKRVVGANPGEYLKRGFEDQGKVGMAQQL